MFLGIFLEVFNEIVLLSAQEPKIAAKTTANNRLKVGRRVIRIIFYSIYLLTDQIECLGFSSYLFFIISFSKCNSQNVDLRFHRLFLQTLII